jgi:hypothetical protein
MLKASNAKPEAWESWDLKQSAIGAAQLKGKLCCGYQ